MKWFKVFDSEILQHHDFVRSINVAGKRLCVIKTDQQIFITQASCPHAGADLSKGWCEEGKLVCPYHRYQYDLTTGRGLPGQGDYIKVYPTEWRDNSLFVGFKDKRNLLGWLFGKDKG